MEQGQGPGVVQGLVQGGELWGQEPGQGLVLSREQDGQEPGQLRRGSPQCSDSPSCCRG